MLLGQIPTRPAVHHPTDPSLDRAFSRDYWFRAMGYEMHAQEVIDFHLSDAPIRIVSAPARTSKSQSAAMEVIAEMMPTVPKTSALAFIVGPTFKTCKEFDYIYDEIVVKDTFKQRGVNITKAHNNPNNGDMVIVLEYGKDEKGAPCRAIFRGMSCQNLAALQGEDVSVFCGSEAAEHPEEVWTKYISPRYYKALFPTTPKPYADWIHDMILRGAEDPEHGIEHFHYPKHANPVYNMERYERARLMAASRTESGDPADDPYFAEQMLGLWGSYYTGQVLPFRADRHVLQLDRDWLQQAKVFVSCDYGYNDACVALFWALMPSGAYLIFDEIYKSKLLTHQFVDAIGEKLEEHGVGDRLAYVTGDPKQPQVAEYMQMAGLRVITMNKKKQADRAIGHRLLVDLLSVDPVKGHPMLFISELCTKTRKEWEGLRYRENIKNEYGSAALSGPDHAFDAAKYGALTTPGPLTEKAEEHWMTACMRQVKRETGHGNSRHAARGLTNWAQTGVSPYARGQVQQYG